jgi:hypothetical protein
MTATTAYARSHAENAKEHGVSAIEKAARAGYAARGAVYVLIGGLALAAAFSPASGSAEGSRGALTSLLDMPFGQALMVIIAIGLFGYALWRLTQAFADPDHHGSNAKGIAVRGAFVVSGVSHTLLALYAMSLVFGWTFGLGGSGGSGASAGGGSGGGSQGADKLTAELMAMPAGRWLVGIVGVAIVIAGIAQFVRGYKAKFEKYLDLRPDKMRTWSPVCRAGLYARGVAFAIIGGFVIVAAYQADPSEARGLGGALNTLRSWEFGPWLLGLVAIGLLAFAVYSFLEAGTRRIRATD